VFVQLKDDHTFTFFSFLFFRVYKIKGLSNSDALELSTLLNRKVLGLISCQTCKKLDSACS